ncbi:glutamate--cysteine ligase [Anaeromyxobacter sp. PSR-1]|uniref:glutamate--cysteine ligase n=1 Tax=Anaeromyxobacter sp. PSR-1 TaxID=1300915 RepID=UPI0005E1D72C|nr:glutamate-cysteine ligase family protein [Anaeromyxobacter sp. PSR-1]GAO04205.1 glutamate--cysteine ligase, chloroplastic [Anaeromyxobacter sp. PSR-1]
MSLDARVQDSPPVRGIDDLAGWFAARERPRADWKVGLEHEKFALAAGTLDPIPYDGPRGVAAVLRAFSRYGYEPFEEDGRIIASQCQGLTVSIEPGGQIELSGRPFADVHVVAAELDRHLQKCREIAGDLGLEFLAAGYRPWGTPATSPWMPKNRYAVMRPYLAARGRLGPDMMAMTASAQASFDFSGPRDMAEKLRVALAVQPAVAALFANSPIVNGRPAGWKSYRVAVWEETEPTRAGLLGFAFEPGFDDDPYRRYAEWALDVPMIFFRRDGGYVDPGGRTFRQFLADGIAGERPTLVDWEDHLTTLFPEVRVKGVVEVRAADACDAAMTKALVAFWKGLLYDREARAWAWDLVRGLSVAERRALMIGAGREGLEATLPDGRTLADVAGTLLDAAGNGLCRQHCCGQRGEDERVWLAPLRERAASGRSPADDALDAFRRGDRALAEHLRIA